MERCNQCHQIVQDDQIKMFEGDPSDAVSSELLQSFDLSQFISIHTSYYTCRRRVGVPENKFLLNHRSIIGWGVAILLVSTELEEEEEKEEDRYFIEYFDPSKKLIIDNSCTS